jgi:hypothetical protein
LANRLLQRMEEEHLAVPAVRSGWGLPMPVPRKERPGRKLASSLRRHPCRRMRIRHPAAGGG